MTFTSYAQNLEDVVLWRALKHIDRGVYIDIGAQHPVVDSVSKGFYEQGWRGTHVEPVPAYAALLREDRPDEKVLQIALSDFSGVLDLHVFPDTGLSTSDSANAAALNKTHGLSALVVPTPALPIHVAFADLKDRDVHWMKIDVEGEEARVLRGWDSQILRPWIIVIEATVPLSQELHYEEADALLVAAGYRFCYFDGLNRFYVAQERAALSKAFASPPNVFDETRFSGHGTSWLHRPTLAAATTLERLDAELLGTREALRESQQSREAAAAELATLKAAAAELQARAALAEQKAALMTDRAMQAEAREQRATSSVLRRFAYAAMEGRLSTALKHRVRTTLRVLAVTLHHHPKLQAGVSAVLNVAPPLKRRLSTMLAAPPGHAEVAPASSVAALSPDAKLVFKRLTAIANQSRSH